MGSLRSKLGRYFLKNFFMGALSSFARGTFTEEKARVTSFANMPAALPFEIIESSDESGAGLCFLASGDCA